MSRNNRKLEPITYEELKGSPSMQGLVDFLITPATSDVSEVSPESTLLPDSSLISDSRELPESRLLPVSSEPAASSLLPAGTEHIESRLLPDSSLQFGQSRVKALPPGSNLLSDGTLLSGSKLQFGQGKKRIVRILPAKNVQDGHTAVEHRLLSEMWKRGTAETETTRLFKAGLATLATLAGCHKTSCRDHIKSLIIKLALEEAESYVAEAGKDGGRVYRIYSFHSILDRRKAAGLTHVIRTGGVTFVDPSTLDRMLPGSRLPSVSTLRPGSSQPAVSSQDASPGSSQLSKPGSNQLPLSIKNLIKEKHVRTSPPTMMDALSKLLTAEYGNLDDAALDRVCSECLNIERDATPEEIADLFMTRARMLARNKNIQNLTGLLLSSIPDWFSQRKVTERREEFAEAEKAAADLQRRMREEKEMGLIN